MKIDKATKYTRPAGSTIRPPTPKRIPDEPVTARDIVPSQTSALAPMPTADMDLFTQAILKAEARINALEAQLRDEQNGRRADQERLFRELMDAHKTIARLETELRLRTEPPTDKPTPD